jgi:6-phosphofructokinase 1
MADKFTVGVLTSGGDAPGMNAAIRAVVRTALANNMNVIGVMHGYEGLVNGEFKSMGARDVGGILQRGGTVLLTSRSKRFMEPAGQRDAIRKMNEAGMDALIVIGGEGSMNGAHALSQKGVKVIGIPGSIDNDIWGTNIAIGTDTAMNTIMDAVDKLRDTASSHQRAFLIETMGRNSGYLAVMAGIICGAEITLIPEHPITVDEVAVAVEDAYQRGKTHAIIINAEGSGIRTTELAQKSMRWMWVSRPA